MNQDSETIKTVVKDQEYQLLRQLIVDIDENKWVRIDHNDNESEMVEWEKDMIIRGLLTLL
jgi:uncharacterized membrane-anchored protein YitT (DUF2179 family)